MRLLVLVLTGCFNLLRISYCQELSVIRHSDGDIFTLEGSCTEACTILSSGTASPYTRNPSTAGLVPSNNSCTCQCNYGLPTFREDLRICVNDIPECKVAGFVSNSGQVERVPYVFLPQRGQIIYPHAEIRFEGVTTPVCGIAGAQQLGRAGWSELRNLSDAEPPFRLFRDEGRTFLQWIGEVGLRDAAEGRVVIAKLVCRDASPKSTIPGIFTPCVAFRIAGSPSKNSVREVMFSSTSQVSQGLSATEYTAIGLSSVILALIYVASVSLYLHSRKVKRKIVEEPEVNLTPGREISGLVKSNPLLSASRHFESDTNSGLTESDLADDHPQSDGEQGFENVTSAIVHPHCVYLDHSEGIFGTGSILGERLPEEDVRVVETADNPHQQDVPVLPGTQRRKLYFNPAYFDRQLLLAPPPAAIEFLLKIREVISIAKHKMAAKRFVPTLIGIPEEEGGSEQCGSASKNQQRSGSSSVQGSVTKSRKSQRCTGCPGCTDSLRNLPALPGSDQSNPGESKVRAWLEDVRPPQRRWRGTEDSKKDFQENAKTFARNLEYLKELAKRDFADAGNTSFTGKPLSSWKDNPPMLRTFQNIARSEILESDDRHSVSKRSTKSMFEEATYDRREGRNTAADFTGDDAINAKVRKAIENSFIKQMEENAAMENEAVKEKGKEEEKIAFTEIEDSREATRIPYESNDNLKGKDEKSKLFFSPKKELPDMVNELPNTRNTNTAKRIMDAVIREMVDVKALGQHSRSSTITDYEVDSLERSKCSRKSSTSPESTDQSSPALSTALPMDEELTMQNAVINTRTGEMTTSKLRKDVLERNYYNNLPELISSQRSEAYSLVSEVYVNDGYASPACSDDSGPEIQYEPENPGHLTIKVQDSPENYIKQDESEYEPDTLDRKPMKLKINDDVYYEKEITNETYMDSLERPSQILLRSKGSFRDQDPSKNNDISLQRGYGSLREIYEARLRSNLKDSNLMGSSKSLNGSAEDSLSWKKCKYLRPESRQARRQRQPYNHPDVVPLPPKEEIYQHPKPPRRVEDIKQSSSATPSKNGWGRSSVEAGDPTTSNGAPVPNIHCNVGKTDGYSHSCEVQPKKKNSTSAYLCNESDTNTICTSEAPLLGGRLKSSNHVSCKGFTRTLCTESPSTSSRNCNRNSRSQGAAAWNDARSDDQETESRNSDQVSRSLSYKMKEGSFVKTRKECHRKKEEHGKTHNTIHTKHLPKDFSKSCDAMSTSICPLVNQQKKQMKVEDSGYLSSTDSNGSQQRLLRHEVSSVSETDETESVCDGASESGAESIGTDSVFFGNFRRLSEASGFSKSADSGVDLCTRNVYFQPFGIRNESSILERSNFNASDSETESFITILPPCGS